MALSVTSVTSGVVPVAIVGVSALFPGSSDKQGFWRDILAGRDLITEVPPTHWLIEDYFDPNPQAPDKTYAKRGAFLQAMDFNPLEFAIPPTNLSSTDTVQLLALLAAKQVLDDAAGSQFAQMDRSRMSVILGASSATELVTQLGARLQKPAWAHALRQHGLDEAQVQAICQTIADQYVPWTENSFPGLLNNVVAGRIANRFDLAGTNCTIDAACASSLAAMHLALMELESGHSDLVITGGVDAFNDALMFTCFSKTPALSPSGDCRPFSADSDGTILGEGLGMLALKRLADAERDGDRIYAVVRGLGTSSDGLSKSIYAPVSKGQAKALRRAYDAAGYEPQTVELLEAHGTGTKAGDAAEFGGLSLVFGDARNGRKGWCALGSVKSQIGHTKAAAGSAGLFKAVMALHHKVLPPTIKIDSPNPALGLDESPFYLNTQPRPWIRGADHPRRASVSSFGFGGSNYHVTLEEYTGPAARRPRLRTHAHELLMVAADSAAQLIAQCRSLDLAPANLPFTAHSTLQAWRGGSHRLAIVATPEDAASLMAQVLARIEAHGEQGFALPGGAVNYGVGPCLGTLGMLFSGQGGQYLNMGKDLAMHFDAARAVWDQAAALDFDGAPLHDIVFPKPVFNAEARAEQDRHLTATQCAQPAIGAVQLAQLAVLQQVGITAAAMAGHSFGEFTALAAAGAMSQQDLLRVAHRRGKLMAAAAGLPGAMTAVIAAPTGLVQEVQARGLGVLVPANLNTPQQIVFSGELGAIESLEQWLRERQLDFRRLPVSTAFHSPLVQPAVEPLHHFLSGIDMRPPVLPVFANTNAQPYPAAPDAIRRQLASQLAMPVRFHEQVEAMYATGVRVFLEVGPRAALSAFVDQTLGTRPHVVIHLDRAGHDGVLTLCQALAKLAAAGVSMQPAALWQEYAEPLDTRLQTKPPMTVPILGSNIGRPYPPVPTTVTVPTPVVTPTVFVDKAPLAPPTAPVVAQAITTQASQPALPVQHSAAPPASETSLLASDPELLHWLNELTARAETPAPALQAPHLIAEVPPSLLIDAKQQVAMRDALLAVVSEKTGYPTEMLDLSLELESGLGIDSIKRVEILSAFNERMPGLPEVALAQLATLNTLGEVLTFMQNGTPAAVPVAASAPNVAVAAIPTPTPASTAPDLDAMRHALLAVVSEKTGYPTEMLDLSLELESGLGIDSIKRVEILSAFNERMPGLPEVAPAQLATLNTLAEVLAFMQGGSPAETPVAAAPSEVTVAVPTPAPATTASAAPARDFDAMRQVLLTVVSEKTGYPTEMLDLSLELESGLGIDSIKRVEILSAFNERMPGLPEVAPAQLATLNTLGEVLDFMQRGGSSAPEETAAAIAAAAIHTPPSVAQQPDMPVAAAAPAGPLLPRHVVRTVEQGAAGFAMPGLLQAGAVIGVTDDAQGVAPVLVMTLQARGVSARLVSDPAAAASCAGLIVLAGLRPVTDARVAVQANQQAFEFVKAMAPRMAERDGLLVTVQDTGGDFGLAGQAGTRAWLGGIAALARTAANEWPKAAVKAIDIEVGNRAPVAIAKALADELLRGGAEQEVGLRARSPRVTLTTEVRAAPTGPCAVNAHSVVLATGGARGVTAVCLQEIARLNPRIAILGRTALNEEPLGVRAAQTDAEIKRALIDHEARQGRTLTPIQLSSMAREVVATREVQRNLQAMRQAGAQVLYCVADVNNAASVTSALAQVRSQFGPVTCLVHGAGVVADKLIKDKTVEQFDSVFATKVGGLLNVLDALANDPLDAMVLFSSVAARVGNPGQCDYAMANEVLNQVALAEAARRPNCLVRSIGWGPWDGGMVTPTLRAYFDAQGVALIGTAMGAAAFMSELHRGSSDVQLVLGPGEPREQLARDTGHRGAMTADVIINPERYPYLASHCIGTIPIVPVAQTVEWFVRAAMALMPGAGLPVLRDVRVLRGIRVNDWGQLDTRLRLTARFEPGAPRLLRCELRSSDGSVLHYSASADFAAQPFDPARDARTVDLHSCDIRNTPQYGTPAIFHGPDLQTMRRATDISDAGVRCELYSCWALGWNDRDRLLDVATIDGGVQLAGGWRFDVTGTAGLPTQIDELRFQAVGRADSPVTCTVRLRSETSLQTVCDVALDGGGWSVSMSGLHLHARVGLAGTATALASPSERV